MSRYEQLENETFIWHVDDYGISPEQSKKIIDCIQHGVINSVSVVINSRFHKECSQLLSEIPCKIRVGIHLNLLEGYSVAHKEEVPLLVDEEGVMKRGFFWYLLHSFIPGQRELKEQIKKELMAQIKLYAEDYGVEVINIDSHNHFHMIPIVCKALVEGIEENRYKIGAIRVPKEPLKPYGGLLTVGLSPINFVKNIVLKILALVNKNKLQKYVLDETLFCGVMFTGKMTLERVEKLIRSFNSMAVQQKSRVEVLFHPGGLEEREEYLNPKRPTYVEFYSSKMRELEYETCIQLAKKSGNKEICI